MEILKPYQSRAPMFISYIYNYFGNDINENGLKPGVSRDNLPDFGEGILGGIMKPERDTAGRWPCGLAISPKNGSSGCVEGQRNRIRLTEDFDEGVSQGEDKSRQDENDFSERDSDR